MTSGIPEGMSASAVTENRDSIIAGPRRDPFGSGVWMAERAVSANCCVTYTSVLFNQNTRIQIRMRGKVQQQWAFIFDRCVDASECVSWWNNRLLFLRQDRSAVSGVAASSGGEEGNRHDLPVMEAPASHWIQDTSQNTHSETDLTLKSFFKSNWIFSQKSWSHQTSVLSWFCALHVTLTVSGCFNYKINHKALIVKNLVLLSFTVKFCQRRQQKFWTDSHISLLAM